MINIHTMVTNLQTLLNSNIDVYNITEFSAGEFVNMDPNAAPWGGVYRGKVSYAPRTLGYNNWEATVGLRVIVQEASIVSGEDCETKLESFVNKVIEAASSDKTLDGAVDMMNSISVEYGFTETDRSSLHFQSAIITFEYEVSTQ